MANYKIVDLDAELGITGEEPIHTKKIKLLGAEWTIICDLNSFAMAQIAGGDASGLSTFLINLVHPDEREDFVKVMSGAKGLDGERLGKLLTKLIEVAGERPTNGPSPLPRMVKKRTSTLKSVAS